MRLLIVSGLAAAFMIGSSHAEELTLKTETDKVSYGIGLDIGRNLKRQGILINGEAISRGITDSMGDKKPLMEDQEVQATLEAFQKTMMAKQGEKIKALADKNKKDGDAFLTANKSKEGIKTTASGLQYKVIKEGEGKKPVPTDTVSVNYRGTLIDGTEFDSSYKRGEEASFPVNQVIPAWTEALQLMPVGSKYQLFIPSDIAYGERGAGELIGPNATLIFEVELMAIK